MFAVPRRPSQHHPHQRDRQLLPPTFQLCTPPMGKRNPLGPKTEALPGQAVQRAEAVSRLKLLQMPGRMQEQVCGAPRCRRANIPPYVCSSCSQRVKLPSIFTSAFTQMVLPSSCARNTPYTPYSYSPGMITRTASIRLMKDSIVD